LNLVIIYSIYIFYKNNLIYTQKIKPTIMKKMKFILEFKEYSKKNKLNEGGGAGKEFTFDDLSYDIKFEYSKEGLKLVSKSVELGDKLDIIGYQDGMRDISTEGLFEADITYTLTSEQVGSITVGQIDYYIGDGVLFSEYDKETTLKEIVEKTGEVIELGVNGSGDLEYMYGAGWLTPHVDKETILNINVDNIRGDYSINDYIEDKEVYSLLSKAGFTANITLKATEKFEQLWKELFIDTPYYQDYLDEFEKEFGEDSDEEPLSEDDFYQQHQDDMQSNWGI